MERNESVIKGVPYLSGHPLFILILKQIHLLLEGIIERNSQNT